MMHEDCYPGLRVLYHGERMTIKHVRQTTIILEDDDSGMLAADASELDLSNELQGGIA